MSTPSSLWLSSQVKLLPMLPDLFCECPELMSNPFPTSRLSLSSFPQPLQLPAVVIVFLLLSASLSQPGLFFFSPFFLWIFLLLTSYPFCLSACHSLCWLQPLLTPPHPNPVGTLLSLFPVLTNHCHRDSFFFF